ncbi:hypothetical protein PAXINDRAFT_16468 [Paxillus involutus ATCC 200175]|uniref:Uncharacterized protein n=1 Tax=Paxillus involutus ATCC 200175 TaxID=664439 RepID=A0A0C9T4G3_PAXIN|nr:hypothetical protein PAXINDRAFT_16468 [Paxillus involutus ATCC 200175]
MSQPSLSHPISDPPHQQTEAITLPTTAIPQPSEGWLRNPAWIEIAKAVRAAMPAGAPAPLPSQPAAQEASVDALLGRGGHLVSVCMVSSIVKRTGGRNGKLMTKKDKTSKSDYIQVDGNSHMDFIKAFFCVHDLGDQFSPGIHSGPPFKLWWTGSSGGHFSQPLSEAY